MDEPKHHSVAMNGITMQVTERGEGPLVVLCHGWPESAFSWRHQIPALAAAGYRVVAPDMRGYGGTSAPQEVSAYTLLHLVGDTSASSRRSESVRPWSSATTGAPTSPGPARSCAPTSSGPSPV